mgnify:CR=1 FL=1
MKMCCSSPRVYGPYDPARLAGGQTVSIATRHRRVDGRSHVHRQRTPDHRHLPQSGIQHDPLHRRGAGASAAEHWPVPDRCPDRAGTGGPIVQSGGNGAQPDPRAGAALHRTAALRRAGSGVRLPHPVGRDDGRRRVGGQPPRSPQ